MGLYGIMVGLLLYNCYYSELFSYRTLYRMYKNGNSTVEAVTDNIFSHISSIKDYSWVKPRENYEGTIISYCKFSSQI